MTGRAGAWYEAPVQTAPTGSIVETEDDPTPIVLIVATTLRRAEETPKLREKLVSKLGEETVAKNAPTLGHKYE